MTGQRAVPRGTRLELPAEVLESHVGILGKTGSGKSNLAKVIVESLLDQGARVCVIDPTGTWYGLRLTREREPSPYPVVMFGGAHADIAIGRTHGAAVAETIGTTTTPAVIDTRSMTVGERTEFFTAFGETLLQRNRGPLHLVVDEAHLFAPQGRVADPKSGAMVHAANNLVSLGRGIGLRIILISQRPAKLHKDSLTQVETLIALRLIAPQDTRAVDDWIGEWADARQGAELKASLPSLRTGEAWIWSPGAGLLERRQVPLARTLDTGKPTDAPIELEPIDVEAVQARLGQASADAIANDPRELRRRIAELERDLADREVATKPDPQVIEVPVLDGQVETLLEALMSLDRVAAALVATAGSIQSVGSGITAAIERVEQEGKPERLYDRPQRKDTLRFAAGPMTMAEAGLAAPGMVRTHSERDDPAPDSPPLGKAERAILGALAQYPRGLSKARLGLLTGYRPKAGHFSNVMGRLRSLGYVQAGSDPIVATGAGIAAVGSVERLPEPGHELVRWWLASGRLSGGESRILEVLAGWWPNALAREELAARTGYAATAGHFNNMVGHLRGLGLVDGWRASDDLMGAP